MNPSIYPLSRRVAAFLLGAGALAAALSVNAQVGVSRDTGLDASGNYERERRWCLANTEGEARVDCLKGSGAAAAEKRRGTLDNNGATFRANAMERCEVFEAVERVACQARVMGYGQTSGSVKDGGVIREIETTVLPAGQATLLLDPAASGAIVVVPGDRR